MKTKKVTALFLALAMLLCYCLPISAAQVGSEAQAKAMIFTGEEAVEATITSEEDVIYFPVRIKLVDPTAIVMGFSIEAVYDETALTLVKNVKTIGTRGQPGYKTCLGTDKGITVGESKGASFGASDEYSGISQYDIDEKGDILFWMEFKAAPGYTAGTYDISWKLKDDAAGNFRGVSYDGNGGIAAYNAIYDVYFKAGSITMTKVDPTAKTPVFTTQPQNVTYRVGDACPTLTAEATVPDNSGTLSYQWYSNTVNSNEGGAAIDGAVTSAFTVPATAEFGARYYYCVATNTDAGQVYKTASNVAVVTYAQAEITTKANIFTGDDGVAAIITSEADTIYVPVRLELLDPDAIIMGFSIEAVYDETALTLVKNVKTIGTRGQPGYKTCLGTDKGITVGDSKGASFGASDEYSGISQYDIDEKGDILFWMEFKAAPGYTAGTYDISWKLKDDNPGNFRGVGYDGSGSIVSYNEIYDVTFQVGSITMTATYVATPVFTTQPANAAYQYGEAQPILTAEAVAEGEGVVTYQWYSNTTNSNQGGTAVAGATASAFTVPETTVFGDRYYYCVATNTENGQTASAASNVATVTYSQVVIDPYAWEWDTPSYVYDGTEKTVTLKADNADLDKVDVAYTDNAKTDAGDYTASAALTLKAEYAANYKLTTNTVSAPWGIDRAAIDPYAWEWNVPAYVYDGTEKTVILKADNPGMDKVNVVYTDNAKTDSGDYTASAALTLKAEYAANYRLSTNTVSAPWGIDRAAGLVLTGDLGVRYNDTAEKTILAADIHQTAGEIKIAGVATADADGILAAAAADAAGTKVTWQVKSGLTPESEGKTAAITVTFTSKNYQQSTITYTVTLQGGLPGDMTGDGEVDFADAAVLYAYVQELLADGTVSEQSLMNADVSGDGEVDFADAAILYAYVQLLLAELPA